MNQVGKILGDAFLEAIRQAVREEIEAAMGQKGHVGENPQSNNRPSLALLTVEELAQTLKVPRSWIYDRVRRKKDAIPHMRVGRYPRFDLKQILAWLERSSEKVKRTTVGEIKGGY